MKHNLSWSIHRDGWKFVAIFAAFSVLLGYVFLPLCSLGIILTAWCLYFFRNPERVTPTRANLVVSPADGIVTSIGSFPPPPELNLGPELFTRISIFLNVFNVHVNRIPIGGRILQSIYNPGKFFNATLDKASEHNERQTLLVETDQQQKVIFVQIAGLIARRICCDVRANDYVLTGARFGLIRFGSRVDVYLPHGSASQVTVGQIMIGGETVLADLNSSEPSRIGELR